MSKLLISRCPTEVSLNIAVISVTLDVLKLLKSIFVALDPQNIADISVTLDVSKFSRPSIVVAFRSLLKRLSQFSGAITPFLKTIFLACLTISGL